MTAPDWRTHSRARELVADMDEPYEQSWIDEATGFKCEAKRHSSLGHWCGYVGVPLSHPWHGKHYDNIHVYVHGGLTYANGHYGGALEALGAVADGREDVDMTWWVGFDCAHAGDFAPYNLTMEMAGVPHHAIDGETYRDIEYVRAEIRRLCLEAAKVGDSGTL